MIWRITAGLPAEKISINVFNWGEYISDGSDGSIDVNAAFEELTRHPGELLYLCHQ